MEKQITLSLEKARSMYGKSTEMDELLLVNFTKDELTKKELPKSWDEIGNIYGYYISSEKNFGEIMPANFQIDTRSAKYYHRFATEAQAKSALAMAQLSQLMAAYNAGWVADWSGKDLNYKWVIKSVWNKLSTNYDQGEYHFLSFKTKELRDQFLANFEPLIKQYFMID